MVDNKNEESQKNPLLVMVVDDDVPTRILLRAALSQWGYKIIEASDGEEAWQMLQNNEKPDLLLSDWVMPKLDGLGLCERIKNELTSPPYIILLTQMGGTANIIKGLEAGADEFLAKPFNMAELRSRLSVGARIIQYEKKLSERNNLASNFNTADKKILFDSIKETVSKLGGTVAEEKNTDHLRMIIDFPQITKEKA